MKAKKLFPDKSIKRLWNKLLKLENDVDKLNNNLKIVKCSQEEYDSLSNHPDDTVYIIKG